MARLKEQRAWDTFKRNAEGSTLDLMRVENLARSATPDVNGINDNGREFWLELKALDKWPARASTCPLKGAFEKGQLGFCLARRSKGGHSYVLLRVDKEYFLIDPYLNHKINITERTTSELMTFVIVQGVKEIVKFLESIK